MSRNQPKKRHPMTLPFPRFLPLTHLILTIGLLAFLNPATAPIAMGAGSELTPEEFPIGDDGALAGDGFYRETTLQATWGESTFDSGDPLSPCNSFDPAFLTGPEVLHSTDASFTGSQISYVVANVTAQFTTGLEVEPGGEYITAIQFSAGSTMRRGHPASVTLFANPDTDFNPSTAYLVHHEHGFVDPDGNWTTIEFSEPVYIGPAGTKFFAGVVLRQEFASQAPMRTANNAATEGRSWDRAIQGSDFNVAVKPTSTSRPDSQVYPIRAIGRSTAQVDCLGIARMDTCDIPCTSTLIQRISKTGHYDYNLNSPFVYNVRFSGPVTGVTTAAFEIATTGTLSGYEITSVTGSGENYLVEISRAEGTGVGKLTLTKGDLSGILDGLDNPVADFFPWVEPYRVYHQSTRLVASHILPDPDPGFEFTFNTPVLDRPDFSLTFQNYFDVPNPTINTIELVGTSPYGSALSLDASSADGTAVAATAEYFPNDDYTIEAWVHLNSHVEDAPIIDFRNGSNDRVIFAFGGTGNRYLIFESLNSGSTPVARRVFAMLTVPLESWVHVAASVKDGRADLYINGVLHGSGEIEPLSSGIMNENNIGQRLTIANARLDGDMDNLRIWSRALDAVEIAGTMNTDAYTTGTTDLVAQWNFDEGTGTVAGDSSGNGNDITLLADAGWTDSGIPYADTIQVFLSDITEPSYFHASPNLVLNPVPPNYFGPSYEGINTSPGNLLLTDPSYIGLTAPNITSITRLSDELTNATTLPFKVSVNDILIDVPTNDFQPTLTGDLGTASISSTSFRTTDTIWFSGSAGSYLRIPNLLATLPNEEITIEFWQRALQTASQETFRSASDPGNNRVNSHIPWSNGDIFWDFGTWSTTGRLQYTPPESIIKEWNHFALVASNAGNFMRIYRNGVLEAEKFEADVFINRNDDLLLASDGDQFMQLLLREFRIWSRPLDGEEINHLRFSTPDVNDPDLFLYYSFTEFEDLGIGGEGVDIRDLSLQGNHGHVGSNNGRTFLVPSSAPFRVMVEQPDGETGTVRLDVVDTGTILFKSGTSVADFDSGEIYQIDRTSPLPVLTGDTTPTNITTRTLTLTFNKDVGPLSAIDFLTTNVLSLDVTGGPQTFDIDLLLDTEGLVSVQLPAGVTTDALTNPNDSSNVFTYIFDTTPPTGTIAINGGDAFTSTTEVVLTNNITDNLSGVAEMRFRNQGGTWSPWEPFATTAAWSLGGTEGSSVVEAEFRDEATNVYATSASIILDMTAPTGTIALNGGDPVTNDPNILITSSIVDTGGSGLDAMRFRSSGGPWSAWEPYSATRAWNLGASEGSITVEGEFRDGAHNVHTTSSTIILDTTPPSGTLVANGGESWTSMTTVLLTIAFVDNLTGVDEMRFSNDGTSWSPWEPYGTSRTWEILPGDGIKTIHVEISDGAGNVGGTTTSIGLDTFVPEIVMLLEGGAAWTNNTTISVDIQTTPGLSGADALRLQSAVPLLPPLPWDDYTSSTTFLLDENDGLKQVDAFVRDLAGNVGVTSSTISLDTTPPTGTIVINGGDAFTNNATVSLGLTADDGPGIGVADMRFSNDGVSWSTWEPFQLVSTWNLATPGDGIKSVRVQFRDALGNASDSFTDTIFYDTTAPVGTLLVNGSDNFTSSLLVTLNITGNDQGGSGVAEMSFSNDNLNFSPWEPFDVSTSWTLAAGPNGPRSVYMRLRDNLGNEPPFGITAIGVISYDTIPPTGTVTINDGDIWTSSTLVSLTLSATDNLSGTTDMRFSNDAVNWGPWLPYATSASWTINSGDGNQVVYAQFRDLVGNTSPGGLDIFDSILLDQTSPTGSVVINDGDEWTGSPNVTLTLAANDGAGIGMGQFRVRNEDTGPWSPWIDFNTSHPWTLLAIEGERRVRVQYRDLLGNTSGLFSDTILLDMTPPTGTIVINDGDVWTNSTEVSLALTADDGGGAGVAEMRFSNDEVTWSPWVPFASTHIWNLTDEDGLRSVYVQFRDAVQNTSISYVDTIQLDSTPPVGTVEITGDVFIVDGQKYSTVFDFTLEIEADDGSGIGMGEMRFRNHDDDEWTPWEPYDTSRPWTFSPEDGYNEVLAQFRDLLMNTSSPTTDTVFIDNTPPTGSVAIAGGAAFVPSSEVILHVDATDGEFGVGVADMRFSGDGSNWTPWQPYEETVPWTLQPPGEGVRGVFVQFRDNFGNAQTTLDQFGTVIVDMSPPTGSIAINGGAEWVNSLNVLLTLTATDAGGGPIQYRLQNPGAPWTEWAPLTAQLPWQLSPADGPTTVTVQYRDSVNNLSALYYATVQVDTEAPTITLGPPSTTLTGSGPVDFLVGYTGATTINLTPGAVQLFPSGTVSATVQILGGSTSNPTIRLANLAGDGTLYITVDEGTAFDLAGNQAPGAGPSAVISVANNLPGSIASAPPTKVGPPISGTYIAQAGTNGLPISHVNLYVREPGLNWVNAGQVTGGTWSWTPTRTGPDGNGIYQFKTIAVDTAGNMQQPVPVGAFGNADVRVVYNHAPNEPLTLLADVGTSTLTFPMEEGRNVVLEFVGNGVTAAGTITISRHTPLPSDLDPSLNPSSLINEWLRITSSPGLQFDLVIIRWDYDTANVPVTMGAITSLYRSSQIDGITIYPATTDGTTIVSPPVPTFSDWFSGDGSTSVRSWIEY